MDTVEGSAIVQAEEGAACSIAAERTWRAQATLGSFAPTEKIRNKMALHQGAAWDERL
jgi:hypothetical protein